MDRRLIRTAVFGSPDSDEPALCPETAVDLDAFRREHDGITIWCGTMFEGGCGRQLTTRRCTDNRICHFAHYASSTGEHRCGRKANDKDSANHLFAKAHLASWLRAQDLLAEFSYPQPLGSAVEARLTDGRVLRVHLDRALPVISTDDAWEILLGPGVRTTPDALAQRGYIHRIRFDDRAGTGRTMQFGTELPGEGTTWENPSQVTVGADTLVTTAKPALLPPAPVAAREADSPTGRTIVTVDRAERPAVPAARQADPVQQAVQHFKAALPRHPGQVQAAVATMRRLLEENTLGPADAQKLRVAVGKGDRWLKERAQHRAAVIRELQAWPTPELYHQASELVKATDASPEERALVRAQEQAVQRRQNEALAASAARERQRADRQEAELREAQRRSREREERRQEAELREAQRRSREREERRLEAEAREHERELARQRQIEQDRNDRAQWHAPAVRGALKKAAREGRTTTWPEIADKIGQHRLSRFDHEDRLELLVLVEDATPADRPLWSTLLARADDDAALRLYRDVARRLGRPLPDDTNGLLAHLAAEQERLHRQ
ncbi:hypothetical protein ACIP28_07545 [Streptomyces albidoflavus]|uniref:hypothetical protein n=1 Tax=Streptomyces albidoflavus TaxID=1886 RepID=UPI00341E8F3A